MGQSSDIEYKLLMEDYNTINKINTYQTKRQPQVGYSLVGTRESHLILNTNGS